MGREATIFNIEEFTYEKLILALRTGKGLKMTIEVDPNYGKYHFDGHRNCNVVFNPKKSLELNKICPVCRKPLTIGVLNRVEELADRKENSRIELGKPFLRLLPLHELISNYYKWPLNSNKTWELYNKLVDKFNSEFNILLNISFEDLSKIIDIEFAEIIISNRKGNIKVKPGYDGVYGEPILDKVYKKEKINLKKRAQKGLNDFV